jgi:diguanylate cyclase (GGDEF)-like protein
MDIDHFKRINDSYGHLAGDHVLRKLGRLIDPKLRHEELLARYGGEEFVFVLPESTLEEAARFAERMRALVEAVECEFDGKPITTTASFGVARLRRECRPEVLLSAADRELYKAKEAGRNRVMVEADPPA